MSRIDELLEFLAISEGSHTLDEVSRSIGIPQEICEKIVQFLARYGFVHLNDLNVKIDLKVRNFIIATSQKTLLQLPLQ